MKITEFEWKVIAKALDTYAATLAKKGEATTAYELKTAKNLREAIIAQVAEGEQS